MEYEEALAYLHTRPRRPGRQASLERMRRLMERLGNPQRGLKTVHIAGTNGKGSTLKMLEGMLLPGGWRVGSFLSPYLVDFRERIQLCGRMIEPRALAGVVEKTAAAAAGMEESPGEFEALTAAALLFFAQSGCDLVLLEAGLGGGHDATNVIDPPLLAVFTPIGLDHVEVLGGSIPEIAREKCGIIKPGSVVLSSCGQPLEAVMEIMEAAARQGDKFLMPGRRSVQLVESGLWGSRVRRGGELWQIPLVGAHQVDNFLTALAAAEQLEQMGYGVLPGRRALGLAGVRMPARMEVFGKNPPVLLDGAHNPPGARALAGALRELHRRPVALVMGMLADKDYRAVLGELAGAADRLFTLTPPGPRALPAGALAAAAPPGLAAAPCESFAQALGLARAAAGEDGLVAVCGSLFLAAQCRPFLLEEEKK